MIIEFVARRKRSIANFMLFLLYFEIVIPSNTVIAHGTSISEPAAPLSGNAYTKKTTVPIPPATVKVRSSASSPRYIGGPTQPESQSFHSINGDNMVDLFSGDFSYNIPLLDVGGYPIAIGYNSGISMDQEASWVGLGWNINPGTITRNLRGIPDDFNGTDTINKTVNIKPSKNVGVTVGASFELAGMPKASNQKSDSGLGVNLGASVGITHSNYTGFGIESGLNASINVGAKNMGTLTSGLSFTNSSQGGISVGNSLSWEVGKQEAIENMNHAAFSVSSSLSANTRTGLKSLTSSAGLRQYTTSTKNNRQGSSGAFDTEMSFAHPSFTPTITVPYTSSLISVTAKLGGLVKILDGNIFVSGYVSKQGIEPEDRQLAIPAFGYLNYQNADPSGGALLDFNREKDMPYREKPEVPNIAVPSYTYDVFSMSGEGTGGMFRAYRGDIGFVYDHRMRTKDRSGRLSADIAAGDLVHWGVDLNLNRSYTENGPWRSMNPLSSLLSFRKSDKQFEAAYFRNPGEKAVNTKAFYDNIGGDDVVAVELYQSSKSSPYITPTNILNRYVNKVRAGQQTMSPDNVYKKNRDKRTQVISYLTAEEAGVAGLSKYIDNYSINNYGASNCKLELPTETDAGPNGLFAQVYSGKNFDGLIYSKVDTIINYQNQDEFNNARPAGAPTVKNNFSVRWTGRIKADVTGTYKIVTHSDDGVRLSINDSMFINRWNDHRKAPDTATVNMVAGELYNIRLEYYQAKGKVTLQFRWFYAGLPLLPIHGKSLYLMPATDTFLVGNGQLSREKRINDFRKKNHISEISVLNSDGRRYVYGIPVYNLKQKDVTFSVDAADGNAKNGLVKYKPGVDNTVNNTKGKDNYFNKEEVPAYAHSFLLTGLLSPDYVDRTGDGISDDDLGDAVKFNYSKIAGIKNPYKWRTPYTDSAAYNEGLRTDNRDDKGSYVYGEKEIWYLNSIESRNMIATFKLSDRDDQPSIDEDGKTSSAKVLKKLDEINLYIKADYRRDPLKARPVKTIHFTYSYDLCSGLVKGSSKGKLTLKRIWFTYNGNNKKERNPYIFNYNANNPSYNLKSYDRWGNYKDPLQNPGSSTSNLLTNAEYPYALQDSTLAAKNAAAWTLDSIVLPSGGRMKIDYESDDYAFVQNRRAAEMFKIVGLSDKKPETLTDLDTKLYGGINDYLFVSVRLPKPVTSNAELYSRYLEGMDTLFFKVYVKMPGDKFGDGYEYVSCYANLEPGTFGYYNGGQTMWLKMKAITQSGETGKLGSIYSPLAKATVQYLRLSLPSKAYPGSDVGDDIDFGDAVKILLSQATNVLEMVTSFDNLARSKNWASRIDTSRSFVRLNSPYYKKYGGGLRVKRVRIYDHWDKMTNQRESVYGQEYQYTTTRAVNGIESTISSGVATFEPAIGGEENPWRLPITYKEQVAVLAPISIGYTEKPLGETFYPAPSVGYSKVRVRTIHAKNVRSANGYTETGFYTSYDFPTLTDMTMLADSKKRYKPLLSNFLRINACHFVAVSQGFKVELNDMNGKPRSSATYSEANAQTPIAYSESFYKVDNQNSISKHLNNTVMAIDERGVIDSTASIGKDIELMMDMREQHSVTNALNLNLNGDNFTFPFPPVFLLPTLWNLGQREETKFQSIGVTKLINRHGILDSTVVVDKGSSVGTKNLLFDAETGEPVLIRTYNEFDDPVYKFTMPAAWIYDGMSGAYKNINTTLSGIYIKQGKIVKGLDTLKTAADYFTSGDEIIVASKPQTGGTDCNPEIATFAALTTLYAVDANLQTEGAAPDIYFVDRNGTPFTGNDLKMRIIRSGRRNIAAQTGQITSLNNPLIKNASGYSLVLDSNRVVASDIVTFGQFWKVTDNLKAATVMNCVPVSYEEYAGGNTCGTKYYTNVETSRSLLRSDCGKGFGSTSITYVVPAGEYTSVISQADADAKATADLDMNAQDYANANGICLPYYYSIAFSKDFRKNDCSGGTGSLVTYQHPARTDSSLVSQAQADSLALVRANVLGQAYANQNGICPVSATVTWSCSDRGCTQQGSVTLVFKFPEPTTTDIVLLFGELRTSPNGVLYRGSNLFTPPAGSKPGSGINSSSPFIVRIPAGVQTFTTSGLIYLQGFEGNNLYEWNCQSCQAPVTDFFIKSLTDGYPADLKTGNAGVVIHNLP
ncbi:PA14 domain-containing protein [Chitinophaga sp. YR627]|uniref:DUF5977 domain-containing protein n=1 Tax=Chitinophaga sp. YR627 TaxID=1881041 RepID=UPI0008E6AC73|nr:DUF5977 domain-containing protein [Chitinophaga sp. YR627]SFN33795.1 PA14 domain-containing protein [Chitinophaga sp. YR627]